MSIVLFPVFRPEPAGWRETVARLLDRSDLLNEAELSFLLRLIGWWQLPPSLREMLAQTEDLVAARIAEWQPGRRA